MKLWEYYDEKCIETNCIEIQSRHFGGNIILPMEVIAVDYFPNTVDKGNKEKYEFCSYISGDNEKYACDSHAYMVHLFKHSLN